MFWKWLSKRIGGVYECGKLSVAIHDFGILFAWDSVVKSELP